MGQQQSVQVPPPSVEGKNNNDGCPVRHKASGSGSGRESCPVRHKSADSTVATKTESGCPVKHSGQQQGGDGYKHPTAFNVYSTPIDPSNQMPSQANQQQSEGQRHPLSTERVKSTIPKGGTADDTWQYPSAQMVSGDTYSCK